MPSTTTDTNTSTTVPEWRTWLADNTTNDIVSSRVDMAAILLQFESSKKARGDSTSPSRTSGRDKAGDTAESKEAASLSDLEELKRKYWLSVSKIYDLYKCSLTAAVYFAVLEAIICGALVRSFGFLNAGRVVTPVVQKRLKRLWAFTKYQTTQYITHRVREAFGDPVDSFWTFRLVYWIFTTSLVQAIYRHTEKFLGKNYIPRLAFFCMATFHIFVVELGARWFWYCVCGLFRRISGSRDKSQRRKSRDKLADGNQGEYSISLRLLAACLVFLLAIVFGFVSCYYDIEVPYPIPVPLVRHKAQPQVEENVVEKGPAKVEPSEGPATVPQPVIEEAILPDVCPIAMEPLDGDEETEIVEPAEDVEQHLGEPIVDEQYAYYDEYAAELEKLMRAERAPWNLESSPEPEDSVIFKADEDAQRVPLGFLAGRFDATRAPPADVSSLTVVLLGLLQMQMASNLNASPTSTRQSNSPVTNDKCRSSDEGSPVGGGLFSDDQYQETSPIKVATTISSTTSPNLTPSKITQVRKNGVLAAKRRTSMPCDVLNLKVVNGTTTSDDATKRETMTPRTDSVQRRRGNPSAMLEFWDGCDSMNEVSKMLLTNPTDSPPHTTVTAAAQTLPPETYNIAFEPILRESPGSEPQMASTQPPNENTTIEISLHELPVNQTLQPENKHLRTLSISETSISSSGTVTTTRASFSAISPSQSSSSLRSVTNALTGLKLAATAPPFIPRRTLSLSVKAAPAPAPVPQHVPTPALIPKPQSATAPKQPAPAQSQLPVHLPLGVGVANRLPSEIWSPAPKIPVNICPPPPKKRRVRGRARKALDAVASAMDTMSNENAAPPSRTMDINI